MLLAALQKGAEFPGRRQWDLGPLWCLWSEQTLSAPSPAPGHTQSFLGVLKTTG